MLYKISASDQIEGEAWASEQPKASSASEAVAAAAAMHAGATPTSSSSSEREEEQTVFIDAYSQGNLLTGGQVMRCIKSTTSYFSCELPTY